MMLIVHNNSAGPLQKIRKVPASPAVQVNEKSGKAWKKFFYMGHRSLPLKELCQVQFLGIQCVKPWGWTFASEQQVINLSPSSGLTADVIVNLLQHIGLLLPKPRFITRLQ